MKCPKCGYLGFETTDRCRNCGYDFSLTPPPASAELRLRTAEPGGPFADLELRHEEEGEAASLDAFETTIDEPDLSDTRDPLELSEPSPLDRLVGVDPEPVETPAPAEEPAAPGRRDSRDQAARDRIHSAVAARVPDFPTDTPAPPPADPDELPLFPPPAGNPLAVRRATVEAPRARRTTTRPARMEMPPLPLSPDVETPAPSGTVGRAPRKADAPIIDASAGARLAAALVDLALLATIDIVVLWLTLRIVGLETTWEDLATLRPIPMTAFFVLLGFLYVAGFTLGGGQTIGKMAAGIRVIGDDGRGVDVSGAVVRGAGCVLSVLLLGLLFVPALLSADRRAPYDRVAGTRVVKA